MKILTNHIGYDVQSSKQAILACSDDEKLTGEARFILYKDRSSVFEGKPGDEISVAGWSGRCFYLLDFSAVTQSGEYYVVLEDGAFSITGSSFSVEENIIAERTISDILFYFKSQRCTWRWNDADKNVPFYGERNDRVDVSGGWYDAAGDYSKYLTHLSYANYMNPQQIPVVVWSLLKVHDYLKSDLKHKETLLEERAAEEALYGADFLMRMQDPGGYFYTTVFDQWSKDENRRMIAAFKGMDGQLSDNYRAAYRKGGGLSIAALAAASGCGVCGEHSSEDYLQAAEKGWTHLQEHNEEYLDNGKENIIDVYCALLADSELYMITGDKKYLKAAEKRVAKLKALYSTELFCWTVEQDSSRPYFHAAEAGLPVIALIEFHEAAPQSSSARSTAAELVRKSVSDIIKLTGGRNENPFLLARQVVKASDEKESRTAFFMPHNNESGYWWQGENARLASLSCAVKRAKPFFAGSAAVAADLLDEFAEAQISWILGNNPFDVCMLQGHGRNNPSYEEHYPNAPGGICNGITGGLEDENDIDFLPESVEGRGDYRWRWSEQWIPHAAWFLLAAVENR